MGKKTRDVTLAVVVRGPGGRVSPGEVLSEAGYRKPEHALHDLPRVAEAKRVHPANVGVFCGGQHVPTESLTV